MPKSVSTFRTELMQEFGLDEDNDNEGTSPASILQYISESNAMFINHRAWHFRLKTRTQYIYADSTVGTQFTTAAPTIALGSTVNWGSTGRILCDYDDIAFSANDNVTTLTVTSADIDRTHEAGERVLLMYEVPADYNKISSMKVEATPYYPQDVRDEKEPTTRRFWEYEVRLSTGVVKKYLVFPYHTTQKKIYFSYGQKATDYTTPALDLTTTYIEVPEPYWNFLKHMVKARIYRHLEELKMAEVEEIEGLKILKRASIYDSKQHFGNKIPLRTGWDNPSKVMGISSNYIGNGHSR